MRKIGIIAVLSLMALALAAVPAIAASPHFIGTPTCTGSLTTGLTCTGKAAGLANAPTGAFLTADSVTANFTCVNKGGNVAPGQPLVISPVAGPTQDITPRNGQITFSATLPPPPTPSVADTCPNGNWSLRLDSLIYTNVVVHIQQGGVDILSQNLGTFSIPVT
jgi:hypothetical protein